MHVVDFGFTWTPGGIVKSKKHKRDCFADLCFKGLDTRLEDALLLLEDRLLSFELLLHLAGLRLLCLELRRHLRLFIIDYE